MNEYIKWAVWHKWAIDRCNECGWHWKDAEPWFIQGNDIFAF